jgi:hypothetical protein
MHLCRQSHPSSGLSEAEYETGSGKAPELRLERVRFTLRKESASDGVPLAVPVAVGTALTGRPPHRSERAALPHSALASGLDEQPL